MKYENDNTKLARITHLLIENKTRKISDREISTSLAIDLNDVQRLLDKLIRMGVIISSDLHDDESVYEIR